MEWIAILVALVFSLTGLLCIFLVLIGLPGSWIMLALAVIVEMGDRWYLNEAEGQTFNFWVLIACLLLAVIGEILEFFAGVMGAKKGGSSKRGLWGALLGGIVGGVLGLGIPIPFFGSLVGAVIGAFTGALLGEWRSGHQSLRKSLKPASGAAIGKTLGTLAKLPVAIVIWLLLTITAFWI